MMTRRLWTILSKPPMRHPLYRRALRPRPAQGWLGTTSAGIAPYLPLVCLFGGMALCCALSSHLITFVMAIAGAILFNGTVYALNWSTRIAGEIAVERENGEWELLCLLPQGPIGAAWAIATGIAHRDNAFARLYRRHTAVLAALLVLLIVLIPCALLNDVRLEDAIRPEQVVVYGYLLAALLISYVDYVQSIVLGSLIGIVGGLQTRNPVDAQFWAGGVFLTLQIAHYAAFLALAFGLLPPIPSRVDGPQLMAEGALLLIRLALFVGLREFIIEAVWKRAAGRLQADPVDLIALGQAG